MAIARKRPVDGATPTDDLRAKIERPEIKQAVKKLQRRYAKYRVPLEKVQAELT